MKETMEIEKKIKPGYKKTKLGLIPKEWKYSDLGANLEKIVGGGTPSKAKPDFWNGDIPWATVKDLNNFDPYRTVDFITKLGLENSASNIIEAGVLITSTRMALGKAVIYKIPVSINQDLKALYPSKSIILYFLFYWFELYSDRIESLGTGSTVKGIQLGTLRKLKILLPPIPEQRRIAAILSTWDKAIDTLQNLIAKKQERKKGLMQVLLTGKLRLRSATGKRFDGKWKKRILKNCIVGNGEYGINAGAVKYSEQLPTYLRISDIDESGCFKSKEKVSVNDSEWRNYLLQEGDIVFARTGNTTGKSYLYNLGDGQLVYAGFLIKFTTDSNTLLAEYLSYYSQTHRYWNWIRVMSTRSGQPGVNAKEYSGMTLIIPAIQEQQKIASVLSAADKEIENLQEQLEKLQEQKKGLMQKLLTGEVRVKT